MNREVSGILQSHQLPYFYSYSLGVSLGDAGEIFVRRELSFRTNGRTSSEMRNYCGVQTLTATHAVAKQTWNYTRKTGGWDKRETRLLGQAHSSHQYRSTGH